MKKLLLFVLAAFAFAACEQAPIEEQSAVRQDSPDTITVGFEGAEDDTRIQLNEAQKTVWTKDDQVSVFYRSNANQLWQYNGDTGARTATLKRVNAGTASRDMDRVVVVYPYNEDYYINPSTYNVQASLPATQHYLEGSYGLDGNIMISSSEYNQFSLKSVCGWLKLQLTGDGEVVKSITLRGNNGEQVAGELYINSADATAVLASEMGSSDDNNAGGSLVFDDTILTEVSLDCGEGVALGKNTTAFYIALPPQTFEKGFTVAIEDIDGYVMEQSTNNIVSIERNHIQPMAAFEFVNPNTPSTPKPANNEIWYAATEKVEPYWDDVFGATIVSNTFDSTTGKGIITFDGDVTSIGEQAFYECTSLTSVAIPDSVTSIEDSAFYTCFSLTSVTIPDSVTSIGNEAFRNCSSLTSVTIPDSVTTIGGGAFYKCSNLASVTIPDSVTSIGSSAFSYCDSLTEFNGKFAEDNGRIWVVDGTLISFAPAGLTEYTIPDSVTTIGGGAFQGCTSLTSVTIPDSVTTIGVCAFDYCRSLTSATIPDSVTSIGECAFYWCTSLTSVTIPDSVTTIGGWAFYDCYSLTSVTIPDGVTTIGDCVFDSCRSLTSVTIPDSVTTIGVCAFQGCSSLTSVTIPDGVTTIGYGAFQGCTSLTSVYCKATTPPSLGGDVFLYYDFPYGSKPIDCTIYVPTASVSAYKNTSGWSEYADSIEGYDF